MGKVGTPSSQVLAIRWVLLHFSVLWKIDGESHAFPIWWNINGNRMGNHMGKKHPYYGKSMSTNFPVHPHAMGFCYIFSYYEKLMGKPVHFPYNKVYHRMGIYEKKAPILWEKYEYQFTRLSSYHGFCCIFPYCGKFMWKPMHSSYDDIG